MDPKDLGFVILDDEDEPSTSSTRTRLPDLLARLPAPARVPPCGAAAPAPDDEVISLTSTESEDAVAAFERDFPHDAAWGSDTEDEWNGMAGAAMAKQDNKRDDKVHARKMRVLEEYEKMRIAKVAEFETDKVAACNNLEKRLNLSTHDRGRLKAVNNYELRRLAAAELFEKQRLKRIEKEVERWAAYD
ncbi:unnamed protein product [Sphagnum tenellum]